MIDRMRSLCALFLAVLSSSAVHAVDVTKIERTIAKEPAYAGKPKYCLLVFGPEAKTRIWLVLDGDKLYVDKNGNGDLTDDGPPVAAKLDGEGDQATQTFTAGEIRDGPRVHKQLSIQVRSLKPTAESHAPTKRFLDAHPGANGYVLSADIERPGHKGNGIGGRVGQWLSLADMHGYLQFSEMVRDAPIVHFGGPLSITFYSLDELTVSRETDLILSVGTPGVGPGTTAYCDYEEFIPEKLNPQVEITFPPMTAGEPSLKQLYELKERC
jgi:hypothetical protein